MAATASSSSSVIVSDGSILTVINKRLRALRKKLNRFLQMEDSVAQGKSLNKEQTQALSSKSNVVSSIDLLERILRDLPGPSSQEIEIAVEKNNEFSDAKTDAEENGEPVANDGVSDLLQILYFGRSIFDVQTLEAADSNMLMRAHERNCCLTYDYVTDDYSVDDVLKEEDLDLISRLGNLMISRPANSSLSHKDALQKSEEHARLWLANSEQPIEPNSSVTYAYLRKKLNKIISSDYFTTTTQVNPIEVAEFYNSNNSSQCSELEYPIPQVDYFVSMEDLAEEPEEEVMWQRRWF